MPPKNEESRKVARDEESRKASSGFEQRLERLENLAEKLREGNIPLEEKPGLELFPELADEETE